MRRKRTRRSRRKAEQGDELLRTESTGGELLRTESTGGELHDTSEVAKADGADEAEWEDENTTPPELVDKLEDDEDRSGEREDEDEK